MLAWETVCKDLHHDGGEVISKICQSPQVGIFADLGSLCAGFTVREPKQAKLRRLILPFNKLSKNPSGGGSRPDGGVTGSLCGQPGVLRKRPSDGPG
jgi:hypothetical protein